MDSSPVTVCLFRSFALCLMLLVAAGSAGAERVQHGTAAQKGPEPQGGWQEPPDEIPNLDGPVMVYKTVIEVDIEKNGMANVKETIDTISHGFTNKSFPDTFSYLWFFRRGVPFKVTEVMRDGKPAPSSGSIGEKRIFATLGSERFKGGSQRWSTEPKGHHVFTVTYRTGLDIRFGKDRDVLSWDINNVEHIEKAKVIFRVPGNPAMELVRTIVPELDIFSFREWMNEENGRLISRTTPRGFEAVTTKPILSGERLVLSVAIPKGFIEEPSLKKQWFFFRHYNQGAVYSLIGLAALLAFYWLVWFFYGRDPKQGVIMPIYSPPGGLSPAVMRFVSTLRFDSKCFASALISIAVKRHITIEKKGGSMVLRACADAEVDLSPDEAVVFSSLFSKGDEVDLASDEGISVNRAARSLASYLKKNLQKKYLITNFRFFAVGMLITMVFLTLSGWWLSQDREMGVFFLGVSWTAGVFAVFLFFPGQYFLRSWWGFKQARGRQRREAAKEMLIVVFLIPFFFMYAMLLNQLLTITTPAVVLFLLLAILINMVFMFLLRVPNKECRALRDQIDGFRTFLEATEKDRMNMLNPPEKTPELFTHHFPYALALGIEQKWAEGVEGNVSADLETMHLDDNFWKKLVAGDPDELFTFIKTSLREDLSASS